MSLKIIYFHNPTGIVCVRGGVHLWEVIFKVSVLLYVCVCELRVLIRLSQDT